MEDIIRVGEAVKDSPVGPGTFTDINERRYPRVNHVAVTWMVMEDGRIYDPIGNYAKKLEKEKQHAKVSKQEGASSEASAHSSPSGHGLLPNGS